MLLVRLVIWLWELQAEAFLHLPVVLFHMINHTIYKSNLFLSLGSVEKRAGTAELDYLGGLGKKYANHISYGIDWCISISGIPPFNGFFSKWMIYQGLIEKTSTLGAGYQLWLLACIITCSIRKCAYTCKLYEIHTRHFSWKKTGNL